MLESVEKLRKTADDCTQIAGVKDKFETVWITKSAFMQMLDDIEHELEERYIEGPTDKNGDPITYRTMIYQWGALEYIACEMYPDGTYEWFVRGHDISAPLEKAKHVTIAKPPTVEDLLLECCNKYHGLLIEGMSDIPHDMPAPAEIIAEYAERLQLKEDE